MKRLLMLAAVSEALTGLLLVMRPLIVIRLLFNSEIDGAGVAISRIAGIGLIALGVACWPEHDTRRAYWGMLIFGLLAALYLAYVGLSAAAGILLWPAVAVHLALSILLVLAWITERRLPVPNP